VQYRHFILSRSLTRHTDTPSRHVITASHLTAFQDLYDFAALPRYGEIQKKKNKKEKEKRDGGHYGHGATAGTMGTARRRALWARRDGGHYGRGG